MKTSFGLAVVLCSVLAFSSTMAQATPITIDLKYQGMANGSETMKASVNGAEQNVNVGMITFSHSNLSGEVPFDTTGNLQAFCIEFSQLLKVNQTMQYTISAADQWFNASQVDAITRLYTGFANNTGTALHNAAFQLALWELVYDYNDNNWTELSFKSGVFQTHNKNNIANLALSWLGELKDIDSKFSMYVMTNEFSQNQLVFSGISNTSFNEPLPVSAPATLGILGLGLFAMAMRRRQRQA